MGTPEFAVPSLEELIHNSNVVGVFTQPDRPQGRGQKLFGSPIKQISEKHGLAVFQPQKLSSAENLETLRSLNPDLIVVVAYGMILKQEFIDLPKMGCINVHSSLLPRWRGAAPIQWAILSGDSESGVSTMKLVKELDAGPTLLQTNTQISKSDTGQSLHDRLSNLGAQILIPTIQGMLDGNVTPKEQQTQTNTGVSLVTYAHKLSKDMEILDFSKTAIELDNKIRAFYPWPGTSTHLQLPNGQRERLKIREAKLRLDIQIDPGVLFEREGLVLVGTSMGSLELVQVQQDGKGPVNIKSYLNGLKGRGVIFPLKLGTNSEA
jgi:methionyl-tRNA formyltransferase